MSYLLTQMFLYMLVTFLLGLLLGWLIWRYSDHSSDGDCSACEAERDQLARDLEACRAASAKDRDLAETLRNQKIDLENRLDAMNTAPAAAAAPVAATAAAEPVSTFKGTASKPEGLSGPRGGVADNLQEINGVGPVLEKLLHKLGYYHFDQIGDWTEAELAWVDQNLEGFKGRATRDRWAPQAKVLARG